MSTLDRRQRIRQQAVVTGIDFVRVDAPGDNVALILLHPRPPGAVGDPPVNLATLTTAQARLVHSEDPTLLPPAIIAVEHPPARPREVVLRFAAPVTARGRWLLTITHPAMDPYLGRAEVDFYAHCPREVDCRPDPADPAADEQLPPSTSTLARDFHSFRRLLLDHAASAYPTWRGRLEADLGVTLVELMAAVADEHAYLQDRIAREATLTSATQRRGHLRHARLVDRWLHTGRTAQAWITVTVPAGRSGTLAAGMRLWSADRDNQVVDFALGRGLAEALTLPPRRYQVRAAWNAFIPHQWDEDELTLPAGAIAITIAGHHQAALAAELAAGGRWMLLARDPEDRGELRTRLPIRVLTAVDGLDPLLPPADQAVCTLAWDPAQALADDLAFEGLRVHGNLLPATAGRTFSTRFAVHPPDTLLPATVERAGPSRAIPDCLTGPGHETTVRHRFMLPGSDEAKVCRQGEDLTATVPDLVLVEDGGATWAWRPALVGAPSSLPGERHVTLEPEAWRPIANFQRDGRTHVHADYDGDTAESLVFGDDEFGLCPAPGSRFTVWYRLGNGVSGNVAASTLTRFDPAASDAEVLGVPQPNSFLIAALENPLPADGGSDPEPVAAARQDAGEVFREELLYAVAPADYIAAAERLPWVQRGGAVARWTGAWATMFTTADPRQGTGLGATRLATLLEHLDRHRLTGRSLVAREPRYLDIDLRVTVCAETSAEAATVARALRQALTGPNGFFAPDRFTFGQALIRGALEAAIQAVPGVCALLSIQLRRRGETGFLAFTGEILPLASNRILRCDDDAAHPERGSLGITVEGGL